MLNIAWFYNILYMECILKNQSRDGGRALKNWPRKETKNSKNMVEPWSSPGTTINPDWGYEDLLFGPPSQQAALL